MLDADATDMVRLPELARGQDGKRFAPPDNAVGWLVKRYRGGRPGIAWSPEGAIILDLHATMADLRQKVPDPGSYRLYPVDADEEELSPVAHIEVVPARDLESLGSMEYRDTEERRDRIYDIVDRLLAVQEAHYQDSAKMLSTLVTSTAAIQQSTAALLNVANSTIQIANGVQSIDRAPVQIDADAIAAHIADSMAENDDDEPQGHWIMQLLNSPIGMTAMQFANGFAQSLSAAQKAKFAADAAAQQQAAQAAQQQAAAQQAAQAAAQRQAAQAAQQQATQAAAQAAHAAAQRQTAQAAAQAAAQQQAEHAAAQAVQQAAHAAATAVYADDASTCPEDHDQEPNNDDQAESVTDIAQLAPPGTPCTQESTHRDSTATASHSPQPRKARGTPQPGNSRKRSQKRRRKRNQRTRR